MIPKPHQFKLCFFEGDTLWFSTRNPHEMWGDDWDDAPYEHNAGHPYLWEERRGERYWMTTVRFDTNGWYPPHDGWNGGSPFSAHIINRGKEPWLKNYSPHNRPPGQRVELFAGTDLPAVVYAIISNGGQVWQPVRLGELPPLEVF